MNPELTHGDPIAPPADTNIEYVNNSYETQPPIITAVFKSIFVETPKEVYNSVKNFFNRYTSLFTDAYKYMNSPTLRVQPFSTKDYKASCQHTFELALIITGILIFMIKLDWISSQADLQQIYNNDVSQMFMQLMIFLIFAIAYFILIILAVISARLFRYLFKIPVTRQEGDILFAYLTNSLFIVSAVISLLMRSLVKFETVKDNDAFANGVTIAYILLFGFLIGRWAKRFAILNNIAPSKRLVFQILITLSASISMGIIGASITFFILGV